MQRQGCEGKEECCLLTSGLDLVTAVPWGLELSTMESRVVPALAEAGVGALGLGLFLTLEEESNILRVSAQKSVSLQPPSARLPALALALALPSSLTSICHLALI